MRIIIKAAIIFNKLWKVYSGLDRRNIGWAQSDITCHDMHINLVFFILDIILLSQVWVRLWSIVYITDWSVVGYHQFGMFSCQNSPYFLKLKITIAKC